MKQIYYLNKIAIITILLFSQSLLAQTTGKISGKVIDSETNLPLIGANILIEGTTRGGASDTDGNYFIINVPPGNYSIKFQMIGYENFIVRDLRVSVNRTTHLDALMVPESVEIDEVVITAAKIVSKKDQTGSIKNVSSEQIEALPVENIDDVVALQAGVVNGHFRGGRKEEVSYMVDGMQITGGFNKTKSIDIEKEIVQDLEVITGTFNAEYGRAMSGIVNLITKDGSNKFVASASVYSSNYITSKNDVFIGLKNDEFDRNLDYKLFLSGPILADKIHFLLNYRKQDNDNYLNGIYRFDVDNFSLFTTDNSDNWYSEHTGSGGFIPMNNSTETSFSGKLTANIIEDIKFSLMYNKDDAVWYDYDHDYKYNPYGIPFKDKQTNLYSAQINHILSNNLFYELKLSYLDDYYGDYVFKDPLDSRYVHNGYGRSTGPGVFTGGQSKSHLVQTEKQINLKLNLSWQLDNNHLLKTGAHYTTHDLDNLWYQIENAYKLREEDEDTFFFDSDQQRIIFPFYEPLILSDSTVFADVYNVKPVEFSWYLQDKMEFNELVINLGARLDYFDPKSKYPSQLRNPANQLQFPNNPEKISDYLDAESQYQISPRLGLAYQLGNAAILRFSYGHFFQMPPMYALYQNHSFRVAPSDYATLMGNSKLKAEKTVQYEIGLWQEVIPNLGVEVSVYYRDIYDLLSTKIISTFNQIEYGQYTNKDYGNIKGLELKVDYAHNQLYTDLNYTLQFTRGNADNPDQTYNRAGDSMDPIPTLIPMSWDQRHTLNFSVGINTADYGINATGYYNSGTPYTWTPSTENRLADINLFPNNSFISSSFRADISSYWNFFNYGDISAQLTLSIYNLFDTLNEEWVNSETGRAYTAIIRESDLTSHHSDFNTFEDTFRNPSMYQAPREIKIGLRVKFN